MRRLSHNLTAMQEGMLFHSLSRPSGGNSIEQLVIALPERLDPRALRRAWSALVARHRALRTVFIWDDAGRVRQECAPQVVVPWEEHDQRGCGPDEQEERFARFLRADRERGFDLRRAPLLRIALHRLADADYRLTWTFHHALLDGRSYPALLDEVFAGYEAERAGQAVTLPEPVAYETYLDWRQSQDHAGSEFFWRKELRGFAAPTSLPFDRLDPIARLAETGTQRDADIRLSADATQQLRALASAVGVTLGTVVQAGWALLLARYSGETDVLFGTIRAGRKATVPDADAMVGLFINAVPLRVSCPPEARVAEWLRELRAHALSLRPHELTPLVRVQGWSEVPAGTSLFDSLVVFENYELEDRLRGLGGAWSRRSIRLYEQTNYAVTLAAYGGSALCLRLQYDPARFADATMNRALGHLQTLFEALPNDPGRRLADLPILTPVEKHQLLVEWNAPRQSFLPGETLVSGFEQQVARTPERIALRCGEDQLTYRALNTRANQLAHRLRRLGVGPESRVGVFIERSLELVVGILAVLKAGAGYVPLDFAYPAERLAFMIEDAGLGALVTERRSVGRFAGQTAPLVAVDDDVSMESTGNVASGVQPANLAYVIYTSGSTGKPKGVLVTHHNVVRLFQATAPWYQFCEDDVWTLFHSCAFDFSVWEIWGALLYGGRLVVVPHGVSRSPEAFYELLAREQVTVLNQTPSSFQHLVAVDASQPATRLAALRTVIFGGEALEVGSLRPWFQRHGDERPRLVNMYGITETTVHVTYRPITRADLAGGSVIGARIPDLSLYILDAERQPVPIGVAGELYVGGSGLARGYWDRPELTAQRFVTNPFAPAVAPGPAAESEPGRLYRTGDRARYLQSGDIEYLGRFDQQVKIRGFRVELGEIEAALGRHPAVRTAVVVAHQDPVAGQRLVAYVVPEGAQPAQGELREELRRRLPDYMIPAVFVWLERLPLTGNGKVDRRALPAPGRQRPQVGATFVTPRTANEKCVADIWRQVLGVERVGAEDNFFELGGNSFLVVQVLARLRSAGHAGAEMADLFQFPTVRALAAHLEGRPGAGPMADVLRRARRQAAALQPQSALAESSAS